MHKNQYRSQWMWLLTIQSRHLGKLRTGTLKEWPTCQTKSVSSNQSLDSKRLPSHHCKPEHEWLKKNSSKKTSLRASNPRRAAINRPYSNRCKRWRRDSRRKFRNYWTSMVLRRRNCERNKLTSATKTRKSSGKRTCCSKSFRPSNSSKPSDINDRSLIILFNLSYPYFLSDIVLCGFFWIFIKYEP